MRKQNRRKQQRRPKRNVEGIVHIPFTFSVASIFSASAAPVELDLQTTSSPVFGTRITAIAANYQYFKCTKLHAELFSFSDSVQPNNTLCYAYKPAEAGVTDTSTYLSMIETIPSVVYVENQIEPRRFVVPKKFLLDNPQKWFSTITTGAGGYLDSVQGHFYIAPRLSATINAVVTRFTGMISFKNPTIASLDLHLKIKDLSQKLEEAQGKIKRLSL